MTASSLSRDIPANFATEIPSPIMRSSRQGGHSCFPKGTALKVTDNTAYFEVEMKKKGIKMEDSLHTVTKDHLFIPKNP
jgi:hypothetical protein